MYSMLLWTTILFIGATANDPGWVAVPPSGAGRIVVYDLDNNPLQIKTSSTIGTGEKLDVYFYSSLGDLAGRVIISFDSSPQYILVSCTAWTNFPTDLPTGTDKVWKVTLTRTSGIRVTIHCNEKEVLNILLSDSTCRTKTWSSWWSRKVAKIFFSPADTASDYYIPIKDLKCEAPTIGDGKVSPSTAVSPGSSYTVTCNGGFNLKGNSDISCTENNGKATLSTSPTCEKDLKCEAPTIGDGKVSPSTAISPGSSYTVTCNGGFNLKGNSDISCTENNGKATLSTSPTCEKDAKDEDKTKLSFANCLKANAALLVVLTAVLLI